MRLTAALGLALLCAVPAQAQSAGEQLFVPPPKGWVIAYHAVQGGVELTELTPPGQSATEWSEMLAVEVTAGTSNRTPQDVLKDKQEEIEAQCETAAAGPISPAQENGYLTAMRAVACPKSKTWNKGELSLIKVLRGQDRTYVIIRAWRGEPFEKEHMPVPQETTKEWLAFMAQVVLCDARDPRQHLCPSPAARR